MRNVAFLFTGVGNLSGGGGAERFFSDFMEDYNAAADKKFNLFFISDKVSLQNFNSIGTLKSSKNVLTYKIFNNRLKNLLESFQLVRLLVFNRIKLIQVPLYNMHYFPLLKTIDKLPAFIRPKVVITITDAFIPHYYFEDRNRGYNFRKILEELFNTIKIDSVISWYELFKEFAHEHKLIKSNPPVFCIWSRYTRKTFDLSLPKENNIVYAGRLTIAKRPMMFVEAMRILKERTDEIYKWKFFIYGKGNLENEIRSKLNEYGLNDLVELGHTLDMTSVFERSKCFVSTQDFENFPSLSMNEAMAAGNVIIARNAGQTDLFVKDGLNGLLLKDDNEKGLADAIEQFINNPHLHESMSKESIKLTTNVHTFSNFKLQTEQFWEQTLTRN